MINQPQTGQPQGIAPTDEYTDIKGFCCAAPIKRVKELDYVLTPGRYVGLAEEEDDFDFSERFSNLKAEFENQLKEEAELNQRILENLAKVKIDGEFTYFRNSKPIEFDGFNKV